MNVGYCSEQPQQLSGGEAIYPECLSSALSLLIHSISQGYTDFLLSNLYLNLLITGLVPRGFPLERICCKKYVHQSMTMHMCFVLYTCKEHLGAACVGLFTLTWNHSGVPQVPNLKHPNYQN